MAGVYAVLLGGGLVTVAALLVAGALRDDHGPWLAYRLPLLGAGATGFGMAGMSASFAGWAPAVALVVAMAGGLGGAGYVHWSRR